MSIKGGGMVRASIEDSVDASIQILEDNIKKSKEGLITAARNSTNNVTNRTATKTRKQKWKEKQLNWYSKRKTGDISHEKIWRWLQKENL